MISQWFVDRAGQFIAPDDKFVEQNKDEETSLFDILAPRSDGASSPTHKENTQPQSTVCVHCNRVTPINAVDQERSPRTPDKNGGTEAAGSSASPAIIHPLFSTVADIKEDLAREILRAAQETKMASYWSESFKNTFHKLQTIVASPRVVQKDSKPMKELEKVLAENEEDLEEGRERFSLRFARAYSDKQGMVKVQDGYTLLHLAAAFGQKDVVEVLLRSRSEEQLKRTTLFGESAGLVACQNGKQSIVELLEKYSPGSKDATDVIGHTGFANAMVSPRNKNKKKFMDYRSPNDPSVVGSVTKAHRNGNWSPLGINVGMASICGQRILTEDAHRVMVWTESTGADVGFACICDGHSDDGKVAEFITTSLPYAIQKHQKDRGIAELEGPELTKLIEGACQETNQELKKKSLKGGSTAAFALLTASKIVVGNIGDSRTILIQKGATKKGDLTEAMSSLSLNEGESFTVAALSTDHTVESELERLKKAGAETKKDVYSNAKGEEVTSFKLDLGNNNLLAMSRAFGDFEYRKVGLIDTPDVFIHERDFDRDAYLILACDGVWDYMSNEEVARMVVEQMATKSEINERTLTEVAEQISAECVPSGDNISLVILSLQDLPTSSPVPGLIPVGSEVGSPQKSETE